MENSLVFNSELKKIMGAEVPEEFITVKSNPLAWRMRIRFDTKTPPHEYLTKDIRFHNPGWADEDKFKPILYMELFLPVKFKLYLGGMEQYNFFIEALGDMTGGGKAKIESFWLCGLSANKVKTWTIKQGSVMTKTHVLGTEYYGTSSRGWRAGVPSKNPISSLVPI